MKSTLLAFFLLSACGGVEVQQPKPATVGMDTATATATATATGTATATAASTAPEVVVNNEINNTQNNGETTAPATAAAHAGLIAKGDPEAQVQAVLGAPSSVMACNTDQTGWWYSAGYCVGFEGGDVSSQYNVPADKLYLPSW